MQTRRTTTRRLPNGDRVTVTTGMSRNGRAYLNQTVRRQDGTGESTTDVNSALLSYFGLGKAGGGAHLHNPPAPAGAKAAAMLLIVVLAVILALTTSGSGAPSKTFLAHYRSIHAGQSEDSVTALLGKPSNTESFSLNLALGGTQTDTTLWYGIYKFVFTNGVLSYKEQV